MEVIVGRRVEGDNTFKVDNSFVSGKHCKVWYDEAEGVVFVEDLNSMNGTYVDGALVKRKRIELEDKILLGGEGGFETTAKSLFEALSAGRSADVQHDGHSIAYLREVYEEHQRKMASLKSRSQMLQMLRIVPSIIMMGLSAWLVTISQWLPIVVMVVLLVICLVVASKLVRKTDAKVNTLRAMYQIKYSCPKKHFFYGDKSPEVLEHQQVCQFCQEKFH